jgi:hypothetical protein
LKLRTWHCIDKRWRCIYLMISETKKFWKGGHKTKTRTWQDVGLHHIFYKSVLYKTLNLEARNLTLHWRQEMVDLFTCEIGSNVCKTNPRLQWKKQIGGLRSIKKTTYIRWELHCWLGQKLETKLHTYELELRHCDPTVNLEFATASLFWKRLKWR